MLNKPKFIPVSFHFVPSEACPDCQPYLVCAEARLYDGEPGSLSVPDSLEIDSIQFYDIVTRQPATPGVAAWREAVIEAKREAEMKRVFG